jgi:hypothetical protein
MEQREDQASVDGVFYEALANHQRKGSQHQLTYLDDWLWRARSAGKQCLRSTRFRFLETITTHRVLQKPPRTHDSTHATHVPRPLRIRQRKDVPVRDDRHLAFRHFASESDLLERDGVCSRCHMSGPAVHRDAVDAGHDGGADELLCESGAR